MHDLGLNIVSIETAPVQKLVQYENRQVQDLPLVLTACSVRGWLCTALAVHSHVEGLALELGQEPPHERHLCQRALAGLSPALRGCQEGLLKLASRSALQG